MPSLRSNKRSSATPQATCRERGDAQAADGAARPSKPALDAAGASWLRNQGALKHRETAGMPSPVWTAGRLNAESVKSLGRLSV